MEIDSLARKTTPSAKLAHRPPFRVLCIEGGGMRGIYSASYLDALMTRYSDTRKVTHIDLGKAFQLICGTSTGAILACALAADVRMSNVIDLYRNEGPKIFPEKVPSAFTKILWQFGRRPALNRAGAAALKAALTAQLKAMKLIDIWNERGIGLAIPAVEMSRHRSWVFKTPHLENSKHRDDDYTLVDVCMATTAAPVFRSVAWLPNPKMQGGHAFVDGGLWANNPILVGLTDALELTKPGDAIEIFCLGTCPPPSGDQITPALVDRGYKEWRFGADAAAVSISAQQYAFDHIARMMGKHTGRELSIIRFPHGDIAGAMLSHLDLDETSKASMDALVQQGQTDAYEALSACGDEKSEIGRAIDGLLREAPESKAKRGKDV
jgi:uncharacterized protein